MSFAIMRSTLSSHDKLEPAVAIAVVIVIVLAAGASTSCAGSQSKCDPVAIVVHDRCFLDKDRACDEIGCVPPNECVELDKVAPADRVPQASAPRAIRAAAQR